MSRDTYPESEPQHCTQSLHPFARRSSTCTSSRSPNWWEVSWPQVPIPSWMSKSNRATVNGNEREQHQDSDGRMQLTTSIISYQLQKKVVVTMKMPTHVKITSSSKM